jgi:16S rRNA (cytidine1402-2'-O)-methyltransferase
MPRPNTEIITMPEKPTAKLFVVATPIGNLEDMSPRAKRILAEVDVLAAEDTRKTRILYEVFDLKRPANIVAYHEHNEAAMTEKLIAWLQQGKSIALATDGGYPSVSDPGYRLISACRNAGLAVEVIPGPCAATMALVASGLPTSSYLFKGFLPKKPGARHRFLEAEREQPHTLIFYESPHRLVKLLSEALEVIGDRQAAICFELTKKFEKVECGLLSQLAVRLKERDIKGEITVVIQGKEIVELKKEKKGADYYKDDAKDKEAEDDPKISEMDDEGEEEPEK